MRYRFAAHAAGIYALFMLTIVIVRDVVGVLPFSRLAIASSCSVVVPCRVMVGVVS